MGKKKQKGEVMLIEPAQQTAPGQKKKRGQNIWQLGALFSLIGAFIIFLRYMNLHGIYQEEPSVTKIYNVGVCSRYYNHVLYRDLYNVVSGGHFVFDQLYGQSGGENQEVNVSDTMMVLGQYILEDGDADAEAVRQLWEKIMQNTLNRVYVRLEERLDSLSGQMLQDLEILDYWIQDQETGSIVTNTLQTEKGKAFSVEEYAVWFEMRYDDAGNLSVTGVSDKDVNMLTKTLYENARKSLYDSYIGQSDILSYVNEAVNQILSEDVVYGYVYDEIGDDSLFLSQLEQRARSYGSPRSCTIFYGIKRGQWEILVGNYRGENDFNNIYWEYRYDGLRRILVFIAMALLGGGFFYGNARREDKALLRQFYRAPAEAVVFGILFLFTNFDEIVVWATRLYMYNNPNYYLHTLDWSLVDILAYSLNLLVVAGMFFAAWYGGCCLGEVRRLGVRGYLHKRMIFSRSWGWCKNRVHQYYQTLVNLDITKSSRRQVIKLLIINAVVVLLLCTMWVAGWFGVIVYSLLLYFVIKKYISDLQKKYRILLQATNEIADGNLEVRITEHLGVFEPFKPQIYRIEEGFQKAVAEEVKSQRMKTELITNVSHDLKTPLTAIITYVNLLKEENVTEEQRTQYLQILEQKSLRLKALIEDLFEVSKANSKNVTLNLVDVDIVNLLRQVEFEQEDRLEERNLAVRLRLPEEKVIVRLDSQKAYRIYENLFGNIIKYAMEGTRIYVDLEQSEGEVTVRLKNITEQEITVSAEELTERFVRGDASRGTEGSGLGLAIVRSFTELMGGRFSVTVDGDLFTASTTWVLDQGRSGI